MSILLDALRKSEEQRRLGSTPSIHAGSEPRAAGNDAAQQWIPLSLIALSAIAMAWIGWQQYQRPDAEALPESVASVERTPSSANQKRAAEERAVADDSVALTQPDSQARRSDSGRTPVEQFNHGNQTAQARSDTAPEASEAERTAQLSESVRGFEAPDQEAGGDEGPAEPETGSGAEAIALEPPTAERGPRETARAERGERRSEAPGTGPISYWELPQGVRDSLPELRITVLVYADQPEQRFLLMSGQRLVEKDEYQDGVVLDEIRRDGAVFLYRSYRFLVKG